MNYTRLRGVKLGLRFLTWLFLVNVSVNEHICVQPRLHATGKGLCDNTSFFFFFAVLPTWPSPPLTHDDASCVWWGHRVFGVRVKLGAETKWMSAPTWAPPQWGTRGNIFQPVICQTADRYREKSESECAVSPRPAVWGECSVGPGF